MRYAIPVVPLVALLFAACDGGAGKTEPTPSPSPAVARPSPTPEATPTATPTPEPPVETLAFIREGDIWLVNVDGSNERRLNLSNVQSFSWVSSDELYVGLGEDPPGHLLIDLDGNVLELPLPTGGSWSRDGALYAVPLDQQVIIFDKNGGEVARLDTGPGADECPPPPSYQPPIPDRLSFGRPVFAPDGRSILLAVHCYLMSGAYNFYASIYHVSLDGAVNQALPEPQTEPQANLRGLTGPRFSPDGGRIAWAFTDGFSLCPVGRGLTVADADGGNSRGLIVAAAAELYQQEPGRDTVGGVTGFDWGPDGDAVAAGFQVYFCGPDVELPVEPVVAGLYILKVDGAAEEKLVDGDTHSPAWSPSGRFIAYVAGRFFGEPLEPPTIRLLDLTTREVVNLTQGTAPAWQPHP